MSVRYLVAKARLWRKHLQAHNQVVVLVALDNTRAAKIVFVRYDHRLMYRMQLRLNGGVPLEVAWVLAHGSGDRGDFLVRVVPRVAQGAK